MNAVRVSHGRVMIKENELCIILEYGRSRSREKDFRLRKSFVNISKTVCENEPAFNESNRRYEQYNNVRWQEYR